MSNSIDMARKISDEYGLGWSDESILKLMSEFVGDGKEVTGFLKGFLVCKAREEAGLGSTIALTDKDVESYISIQGVRCPYPDCGSENLRTGPRESEFDGTIRQRTQCENCNRTWYDIYSLSDVEEERE